MKDQAIITHVARGCVHDGPGLRTVIYTKGCTLHCAWCHNPQTISPKPQAMHFSHSCIGCGACLRLCPDCFTRQGSSVRMVPAACKGCGKCQDACLSEAIQFCGKTVGAQDLWPIIERDIPYFRRSGGGVTVSGGECLLYPGFVRELFALCRRHKIHTAIETALNVDSPALEKVLEHTDLVIMDLKHMDPRLHRQYTGAANSRILKNARRVLEDRRDVWVRVPLIPGVNDSLSSLIDIAQWVSCRRPGARLELLRYNDTARSRYQALGLTYRNFGLPQAKESLDKLTQELQKRFPDMTITHNGS